MKMKYLNKPKDALAERHFIAFPAIVLIGALLIAVPLSAAPNADVQRELEITDGVISRVEERLPDEPTSAMLENLAIAVDMQADAWAAFERDEQFLALNLTRQAREIALRVERMIRTPSSETETPPTAVLRVLEQNAELIEDLAPVVDEFGDEILRGEFFAIAEINEQAWRLFEEDEFAVSSRLARSVRDRLQRIRSATLDSERRFSLERVAFELERAREIALFAESRVFPEAIEAVELFNMSVDMLGEAELLYAAGRPREAMRLVDEAIVLSRRSIEISRMGGLALDRIEDEFSRTESTIYNVIESFDENTPPEVRELANRAMELLIDARSAFAGGSVERAERLLIESRRTADLARRSAQESGDINRWNVERAMSNTDRIIEHAQRPVEESGSGEATELLRRARDLQVQAREHFDAERYIEALSTTRAAADAANQATKRAEKK